MLPGPDLIYECPHCGNFIKRGSLMSGNTFGQEMYSDAKAINPMLPDFPNLVKCRKCNNFLWLNDMEEVGELSWDEKSENKAWENADRAEFLNIEEYFEATDREITNDSEEIIFIRQRILWLYNDRIRHNNNTAAIFTDEADEKRWRENTVQLLKLLDISDPNDKILSAELHRYLENFEKSIELLNSIDPSYSWVADKIKAECLKENRWVILLNDDV